MIRLYGGRPFALADHLDRLERSAAAIELPAQRAALEPEIEALLEAHGDADAQLRLLVTRGGRRIALIEPLVEHLRHGHASPPSPTRRPMILTGVKSLSYGANMQATRIAKARGADEALLVRPDGIVLEAPTSTIFWVSGGELRTPALDAGILDSITRRAVVEALDVAEGEYELADLLGAERGLPRLDRARDPAGLGDRRRPPSSPGRAPPRREQAFERAIAAELGASRP